MMYYIYPFKLYLTSLNVGCLGTHWYFFFTAPRTVRGGSCLATGAFPVSQMVLELHVPFHTTQQKALHIEQVSFWLFLLLTLVVRDTVGINS